MQNNLQLKTDWQESFTLQQLKDTAKAIGLKNYSKLKKKELIDLIKNSIHNPIIVDSSSTQLDKSQKKIEKLEREVKILRQKSQLEQLERIEKEKSLKEEKQREKYRQVIQKSRHTIYNALSDEEQKIIEIIAGLRFYQANCSTRQQLIDYCNENNYPVPDINGNF